MDKKMKRRVTVTYAPDCQKLSPEDAEKKVLEWLDRCRFSKRLLAETDRCITQDRGERR